MQKTTKTGVLVAGLRGAVSGMVIVAALDQALAAWHDGALWRGLTALGVGVVFVMVLYRMLARTVADTEPADPA